MHSPFKEEIDFRELLHHPQRLFGYTYFYVLLVLVGVGILYAQRLTDIGKASVVPLQLPDTTAQVVDVPLQAPQTIPPVDLAAVAVPTQKLLDRGKELFQANCSSCHGVTGAGDGPSAIAMTPKPRNFHSAAGWTNGPKISEIYRTLQEGIVRNGMASYSYIPPADRFALIHYVRSFVPAAPLETLAELQSLESTYQLSRGTTVAATVPVSIASAKLLAESARQRTRVERMAGSLRARAGDPLVAAAVDHPERLSAAMLADGGRLLSLPPADFARITGADPISLGFRAAEARLSVDEITRLQRILVAAAGPTED